MEGAEWEAPYCNIRHVGETRGPTGQRHPRSRLNRVHLAATDDVLTISLFNFWLVVCIHGQQEVLR